VYIHSRQKMSNILFSLKFQIMLKGIK